jgi:hypothetical protein
VNRFLIITTQNGSRDLENQQSFFVSYVIDGNVPASSKLVINQNNVTLVASFNFVGHFFLKRHSKFDLFLGTPSQTSSVYSIKRMNEYLENTTVNFLQDQRIRDSTTATRKQFFFSFTIPVPADTNSIQSCIILLSLLE